MVSSLVSLPQCRNQSIPRHHPKQLGPVGCSTDINNRSHITKVLSTDVRRQNDERPGKLIVWMLN
jgi:hypothetical protein